jgi:hypothetical protein
VSTSLWEAEKMMDEQLKTIIMQVSIRKQPCGTLHATTPPQLRVRSSLPRVT